MRRTQRAINALTGKAERFFQTDLRYLAKNSFWSSFGKIGVAGIAFALSILYARYLPKELYGDYRYVMSYLGIFAIFSLSDIGSVITRAVARGHEGTAARGIRLMFFSSIGISLVSIGAAGWFFLHGNPTLGFAFLCATLFMPFVEGLGGWRPYLDGRQEFRKKAIQNIAGQILYALIVASAVLLIAAGHLSLASGLALFVAATLFGNAFPNIIYSWRILFPHSLKDHTEEPGAIRYGLHLSAIKIPATVANYIDSILLFSFSHLGPTDLAIYSFALAPTEQIKNLLTNMADIALPKLSLRTATPADSQRLRATLPIKVAKAVLPTALVVACYIALAPLFYGIFFPRYIEAAKYSQIIALSLILFPLGLFGTAIRAEGNLKKVYIYELSAPLIQIAVFALLIPLWGIWGAVAGKVLGRLANHLIQGSLYLSPRLW